MINCVDTWYNLHINVKIFVKNIDSSISIFAKLHIHTTFTVLGVCPVLCTQRGEYINGECQCNPGWKGKECQLRHDECEVPDCNGHGHCTNGKCNCIRGYKGKFCEEGKMRVCRWIYILCSDD